jgi:hypothetical protein
MLGRDLVLGCIAKYHLFYMMLSPITVEAKKEDGYEKLT